MKNWKTSAEEILTMGPVVPVIVIERLEDAVPLAKALIAGGVKVLEVTLRTACALDAIKKIIEEVPEAVVGAGTVTTVEQLKQVTQAGVKFVITPGITDSILKEAVVGTVPVIPGIATISELLTAQEYGLTALKFFPAEINGGVAALKAFAGPCGYMKFCPTGGVNPKNYRDYLALDNVLCVGGTWFIPTDAIAQGDFAKITQLAKEAVAGAK
ncbi:MULTISPECIES: bifunctional 4-hydroxy-2-oxoglutarate aldolase/2-dehydro-3-deoxy-phosphogluconate aldolase [unclassified Gilliamella]|uniref:bifunctional 4-hydroxy-2-oxoglutarate aldolase/2-dehydro-3-deoxy-phosphogluconate aldolase n=1 Tax=unclassified Gilliamella TaxID=2685620 RepID=UPI00226A9175|nr:MULTISPECIES: bifunctional 4-hydroxy-2-oxoglutarate aldolase/2-dehydro-3-deoxy-phosphogluconate aldolase [unclassified Gilliamella]MCX8600535.1 bifunctional 4-hydroxy-2-oxoglutarate aldolase/2-dehydro-3-deoxy-phosphogluconate aldolase [Gilliamella sp. B3722]MCX8608753.1 bifunctional 4-hydroxy-2-oxoglutarate aldolase/2-dehydro-3-deoxy-phosphogluconate aldolase [Gilliamella sp. B3771]MCX8609751.1 bifunctional 4-hydroxy-2-oxoglutarate aldolase/2-dehydro-3-deoxy-phosphogluconate aldolase [Gilliam